MTHLVWPCPAGGFARPLLLDVFALPSAVGTLSPSAGSAMPIPGRCNRHRLATTTAPIPRLKTTQDNIKAKVGHLECPPHGTHRHQLGWFGGSASQRFRGPMLAPRMAATMEVCLHAASIG
ncbi:hypothetical protein KAM385_14030 [Aeromonas hydrophila]|nr:hypothetical protein KAM385_14030 [Aeromonas hydrophila]